MLHGSVSLASYLPDAHEVQRPDPALPSPVPCAYPYNGDEDGNAAHGVHYSHLTIQQEVPNIGPVQTMPLTPVNPTHEQGFGRAPGWQHGWMRKNFPMDFGAASAPHRDARLGGPTNSLLSTNPHGVRAEGAINSGVHAPGSGKWQDGMIGGRHAGRGVVQPPATVYLTAAVGERAGNVAAGAWGEPL